MEINLVLADNHDLPQIKDVYKKIVENMVANGIDIWDEIYPFDFFHEDIEKQRFYILKDGAEIVSALALCDFNEGADFVDWENSKAKSLYIDRFAVNVDYLKQGIASKVLAKAAELAKNMGFDYLRLFVVDVNEPAIKLYEKNGFKRAAGTYEEVITDISLIEYGFEKMVE